MPSSRFKMSLEAALVGFFILAPVLASAVVPRTVPFSNTTVTTSDGSPSLAPSNCCFVVQDTITENWWQEYTTETYYQEIHGTYITTLVSPYIDTTVTNVVTNVKPVNATLSTVYPTGYNPATMMMNNAPQPAQVTGASFGLNGSQIVTAGVTIQSPAPFWIYSTVKIITVPAVTDERGHIMCVTTSIATSTMVDIYDGAPYSTISWGRVEGDVAPSGIFTISGVNSNAEAYFGGYGIRQQLTTSFPTGSTSIPATTMDLGFGDFYTESGYVGPVYTDTIVFIDNAGSVITPLKPTAIEITFPTPFIYLPSRTETSGDIDICEQATGNENYGYVPQTVLDYMTANLPISSQYPGLADCLPGGPSILHILLCAYAEPTTQALASDLTTSTVITLSAGGFFSSKLAITNVVTSQTPLQTSPMTPPVASSPAGRPNPSHQSSATRPPLSLSAPLPPTQPPASSISSSPTPTGSSVFAGGSHFAPADSSIQLGNAISPASSSVPASPATSVLGGPASLISVTPGNPSSAQTTIAVSTNSAPQIVLPGSTATISGTPVVIISSPTTIPLSSLSGLPTLISGVTATISGTPVVVITAPTTIIIPQTTNTATPALPGITTTISGTPIVIISTPTAIPVVSGITVSGHTTVLGGSTTVFTTGTASGKTSVIGGTTAVVVSASEWVTLSLSNAASTSVQVSGEAPAFAGKGDWLLIGSVGLLCAVMF